MKQVIIYIHAIYEFLFTYIEIYEFLIFDTRVFVWSFICNMLFI